MIISCRVPNYNVERPHSSLGNNRTPDELYALAA